MSQQTIAPAAKGSLTAWGIRRSGLATAPISLPILLLSGP